MRKTELFFGYGFVFAGVALPYLIEHLSGSAVAATWTCVLCLVVAAVLLFLGHRSNAEEGGGSAEGLFGGEIPSPPAADGTPAGPEPTLVSLMDTSFPNLNKLWGKPIFRFEDGHSLQITSALYFDLFTSGAKFLGFHIPSSPHTLQACALLAIHAIELGDDLGNGGLSIVCKAPGENPQTINDLRYSGKVYVYHEDALTHKQMVDVEEIFNGRQLSVVLRGPDFLTQAWLAWKRKTESRQQ